MTTDHEGLISQTTDNAPLDIYSHPLGNRHVVCYVYFPRKAMNNAFLMASPTYKPARR
jgi:hypothetical protein